MTTPALTGEQLRLKEEFVETCGTWDAGWESLLVLDPGFLRSYLDLASVPVRKGHLEPKVRAFVLLTVSAAATHLYMPGVRQHIRAALAAGASRAEITEVLELTSTLGIHAANVGIPLLVEVLTEEGLRDGPAPLDERQERLKAEFTATRGYWHPTWNEMLELDPDLFASYTEFSSVPWRTGVLEPKVKEFVYTAFDVAATHLYSVGLKLHLRNAIRLGATPGELLEIIELASLMGIHGAVSAAPVLIEEAGKAEAEGAGRAGA